MHKYSNYQKQIYVRFSKYAEIPGKYWESTEKVMYSLVQSSQVVVEYPGSQLDFIIGADIYSKDKRLAGHNDPQVGSLHYRVSNISNYHPLPGYRSLLLIYLIHHLPHPTPVYQ